MTLSPARIEQMDHWFRSHLPGTVEVYASDVIMLLDIKTLRGAPHDPVNKRTDVPKAWAGKDTAWWQHVRNCWSCSTYFHVPTEGQAAS